MADNIFTKSPAQLALSRAQGRSVLGAVEAPSAPAAMDFDALARSSQVPQNIIEAAHEMSGLTGAEADQFAQGFSQAVGAQIAKGVSVKDAVRAILPQSPDVADALLSNAVARVNPQAVQTPDAPAEARSVVGDFARRAGSSVVRGGAASLEGLGRFVAGMNGPDFETDTSAPGYDPQNPDTWTLKQVDGPAPEVVGTRQAADAMRGVADSIASGISKEAQEAMQGATFKGDVFKPSTWEMPENPSVEGLAHLTVDVLGSMAPVVITALVTRSPIAAAGTGGTQSMGAGAETAREVIEEAAKDVDESGLSRLARESAYYRTQIEAGASPEEALARTSEAAEQSAAAWAFIPGALGGAATGRILEKPLAALASKGVATRVAGTAAASAAEEGAQEVAETVASRFGTAQATGLEVDLTEDTLNDAVLGALGGGPVGGLGGLRGPEATTAPEQGSDPSQPSAPLALPAPAPTSPAGPTAEAPQGPLSRAAAKAPVLPEAPTPMAERSMVAGSKVVLEVPGGNPIEAVFKGETEDGMTFDQDGNPFLITRAEIEAGEVAVRQINPVKAAQAGIAPLEAAPERMFDKQTVFDVSTEIDHAIHRANAQGDGFIGTVNVKRAESAQAMREGAAAALQGMAEVPTYGDGYLDAAAQEGYQRALNMAQTRRTSAPKILAPTAPRPTAPATAKTPRLQKRPFTQDIKNATGGIDPNGALGQELLHLGVNPQTTPGLFRSGGVKSLDNLPAAEWSEYALHIGEDGNGYLNEQGIIAALADELAGKPVQVGDQAALQAEADLRAELAELMELGHDIDAEGFELVTPEMAQSLAIIPPRDPVADDFSLGQDRENMIRGQLLETEHSLGMELSAQERKQVFDHLNDNGGTVQDVLWSMLEKEPQQDDQSDEATVQSSGPAVTEHGLPEAGGAGRSEQDGRGSERSAGDAGAEVTSTAQADDAGGAGAAARADAQQVDRPTGYTFKLFDRLEKADARKIATLRASGGAVADIVGKLDEVTRRAEAQMRKKGVEVGSAQGAATQEGRIIDDAVALTAAIAAEARKLKAKEDLPYVPRDEDTGEWISDGTAMGDAYEWYQNIEAMGLGVDTVDESAGNPEEANADPMPEEAIFPKVKETVSLMKEAQKAGEVSFDEGQALIQHWKSVAADIGKTGKNADKVVISLFDYTGAWSQPWQDAGYQVQRHDVKSDSDILLDAWIMERITEYREAGLEVVGVLSACPCTTFAGSGARWWQELHDVESPEALEKVFGPSALYSGAKSPVEYNKMLYEATREAIRLAAPTRFHVLENPIGRIQEVTGLSKPTARFHPHNFGDPYTKNTQLFGPMQTDLPFANVDPVEGSKMQSKLRGSDAMGKEARSTTPEGFSYAFFMANDPDARLRKDERPTATAEAPVTAQSEATPEGEQTLIPGVAPITDKARAEKQMTKPKRGGNAPTDFGLFDTGARAQADMFSDPQPEPKEEKSQSQAPAAEPVIEPIRERAAVLRGIPKDQAPEVPGVSLKWDEKAGGFIFSRKHTDKVREAVIPSQPAPVVATPSKAEFDAAAAEANPAPTPAQAEAGNYKKGHIAWQGLDLAIETAKGETRRGTGPDGTEWSVEMPAHYGDIKGTKGADGDPLDFYMGDAPDADYVVIVNQVDPETQAFDEHKIVLGTMTRGAALDVYRKGFSDGSGNDRIGSVSVLTVDGLKSWLDAGDLNGPSAPITMEYTKRKPTKANDETRIEASKSAPKAAPEPKADPAYGAANKLVSADRAAELRARLKDKLKTQLNSGIDPEIMAIGAELAVFHIEAGARKFIDLARAIADDLGTTPDKLRPYLRSWYNGARDMMEDHEIDIEGMDDASAVREALKSGAFDAAPEAEPEPAPEAAPAPVSTESPQADMFSSATKEDAADDNRDHAGDGGTSTEESPRPAETGAAGAVRPQSGESRTGGDRRAERSSGRSEPDGNGARNRDGERTGRSPERPGARNHVIPAGGLTLSRGEKTRARESIAAIRTLRELEQSGLPATAEQREILSHYGGAGTLAGALPRSDGTSRHEDLAAELKELLTDEEYATLSKTSQYAFYTAEPALRGMWRLAEQLGFKGGRVYEPGMGVGGFAGTIPEGIRASTSYEGLELDHVTAAIAQKLYPAHKIKQGDFIKTALPQGYYDLVIGNPPFSGTQIKADPDYPQGFMIHDYFFAKSLDAVRPGGLLMFVTSAGTMNKLDSTARDYLADRADLVGAIRLPNTAFKENGTEVTTDIVVLRKRAEGEKEASRTWRNAQVLTLPDAKGESHDLAVNSYFAANPDMILGEQGAYDTLTAAARVGVRPRPDSDLAADLAKVIAEHFPRDVMTEATGAVVLDALDTDSTEKKTGSYYLKDGELMQFDGRVGKPVVKRAPGVSGGKTKTEFAIIKQLIPVKDALRDVYAADLDGKDAAKARAALNRAYDEFVKRNGPIGKQVRSYRRPSAVEMEGIRQQELQDARAAGLPFNVGSFDPSYLLDRPDGAPEGWKPASMRDVAAARKKAMEAPGYTEGDFNPDEVPDKVVVKRPNIDMFMDDPESYRLLAIEKYDEETDTGEKTAIFTKSTVSRAVEPVIKSPEDALLHFLAQTGRIDMQAIADKVGSDPHTVRLELGEKVFKNPVTGEFETRTKYLSGNVRQKLEDAQRASLANPEYRLNVTELEAVQPDPVTADEIRVPIGAHWFDESLYSDFARDLGLSLTARFNRSLGLWAVVGGDSSSAKARNEWGTADKPFGDLMIALLNNKKIEVRRVGEDKKTYVDEDATQAAKDKGKELQEKFSEWIWEDEKRKSALEDLYNRTFNGEVAPKYDGGYLTTPGINSAWRWRPHQTSVIARILQSGSTYMAHTVGAGKTSAMIGAGMEARRLGLAKKPMYSVPNHMLVQFTTEFYHQYPLAKILVADEKRFEASKRKQFIADAALGDWDAIIITHSGFEKIPPSEASVNRIVQSMISEIKNVFAETDSGDGRGDMGQERAILGALGSMGAILGLNTTKITEGQNQTRKKIEALIEAAEQRMARQVGRQDQDDVFDFDELGVDMLFVDEAHLFRKLSFATTNGNIKGIDPQGSQMSMDLFVKTRALEEINPGRGLVLASGTPITNTMAELYSISRYLQPGAMEERGVAAFDAWASTFGTVDSELEQLPDGGYKQVARFSKFVNTPELSLMVRQVMDVITSKDLEQYVTRPALKGGKRNLVLVEASPEVRAFQSTLAARMDAIAQRKGPVKKGDDILLSVINDGRLSAIDSRLVDASSNGQGSKLEALIENAFRNWKEGANAPLHGVKPEGGYTDAPIEHGPTTQIIFSTLGIKPTKHNAAFSVHRYIKAELVRRGIPASDIILSEDLKSHVQKQRAFNDMNEGAKRILIGSKSLFTGVNAQRRLKAIHNLDPLWFPADDEQRNGRGLRQGNMNPEIEINDYSTKGTYDATMWQMMGRKAAFIEGFFRGDPNMRDMEDLGEASQYQQATALSTRDPRVLELTEMRQKRDELDRRRTGIERQRNRMSSEARSQEFNAQRWGEDLAKWVKAAGTVVDLAGDKFRATLQGTEFDTRKEFGQAMIDIAISAETEGERVAPYQVGQISGFPVFYSYSKVTADHGVSLDPFDGEVINVGMSFDPVGMARKLEGAVSSIPLAVTRLEEQIERATKRAEEARAELPKIKPFGQLQELRALEEKIEALESALETEAQADQKARTGKSSDDAKHKRADALAVDADVSRVPPTPPRAKVAKEAELKAIANSLNAELQRLRIPAKIKVRAWSQLSDGPFSLDGMYHMGNIEIAADARQAPIEVMRHELIHALRDPELWGSDYGLFSQEEWRTLVREARERPDLMAQIERYYPDLTRAGQMEEAVAELYREWATDRDATGALGRAFKRISAILKALANALRGQGLASAAAVFERIERGDVGGRGDPNGPGGGAGRKHMRRRREPGFEKAKPVSAQSLKEGTRLLVSDSLTQAMAGWNGNNLLALVPGRALFSELGAKLPSAQKYLRLKEEMDALRNQMHADIDELAQKWRKAIARDRDGNQQLMDLMHDATIAQVDPSKRFRSPMEARDPWLVRKYGLNTKTGRAAQDRMDLHAVQSAEYERLRKRFDALPADFQALFGDVRDAYTRLADDFQQVIEANADKAMSVAVRRAERAHEKRMQEIRDDGLRGKERDAAVAEADAELKTAKAQNKWMKAGRLHALRERFEANRLEGPYFPLSRFGEFYVTLRDDEGRVTSFSRFQTAREQRKFAAEMRKEGHDVETGVMKEMTSKDAVDPGFVADVEALLDDIDADNSVKDAVWQRWLMTLPDMSVRKNKIHRKGTPGYSGDAFRAFGDHMFHGAHQLARLKYSLDMAEALDVAEIEARASETPERTGLIVKEMTRRHEYVMNPQGSAWAQTMTSAAFVYYLSMTPAAALVNLSQTTVVGIPILGAFVGKRGTLKASNALMQASRDFLGGRGAATNSKRLTKDEKEAMQAAYDRGVIDKSQAHDLAGVGETGVNYSPLRSKVMGVISWAFHHAERANREVTFLAAYRLAREKGLDGEAAIRKAGELTWKTHFDYQNTSRPRLMQNDYLRVAMVFRNFQVNMLWRLFRDTHQALHGESAAVKAEARRQLTGITTQMLLHAGVKGVWGYSLTMGLLGLFFGGGSDELEKEMEKAVLAVLPKDMAGMLFNGVPGHLLGIDLRSRIGMPDLWFRSPDRQLEGEDEYNYWVQQLLGAVPGMAQNIHRGFSQMMEGNIYRGAETVLPKALRDVMRSGRYAWSGATTYKGDPIIDDFSFWELAAQFIGFTPARLSEQYDANRRMKNEEQSILSERSDLMKAAAESVLAGGDVPAGIMAQITQFNAEYPEYPIDAKTLRRSVDSRVNASLRNEKGAQLNPKLNRRIREGAAPLIYGE